MRKLRIKRLVFRLVSFVGKLTLLFSTFLIGIAATIFWSEISPPTVTLCQLAQNPDLYRWQIVKVEADAVGGFGTIYIADKTCQLPEAEAGVWREEGYKYSEEVLKFYSESESENYKARILVTGRFDPDATKGCYVPKAAIKATNIELKSEITTEPRQNRKEEVSNQDIAARQFFTDFQKAVASNNKKRVASMMHYPLRVNFYTDPRATDYRFIESQSELLKVYEQVFSYSVKDYISKFNPVKIWGNDYFMQTDSGQIGIAVSCKNNKESCDYDFKVKIIHSNSIEIDYQSSLCGNTIDCYLKADNEQNKGRQN